MSVAEVDEWESFPVVSKEKSQKQNIEVSDSDEWESFPVVSEGNKKPRDGQLAFSQRSPEEAQRMKESGTYGIAKQMASEALFKSPEEQAQEQFQQQSQKAELGRTLAQVPAAAGQIAYTPVEMLKGAASGIVQEELSDTPVTRYLRNLFGIGAPEDEQLRKDVAQEAQAQIGAIPSYEDVTKGVEEVTGIPLEAKTKGQKAIRFGAEMAMFGGSEVSKVLTTLGSAGLKRVLNETPLRDPFTNVPVVVPKISNIVDFRKFFSGVPTQELAEIEAMRQELGLPVLPLSETQPGKAPKYFEKIFRYLDIGQEGFDNVLKEMDQAFVEKLGSKLETMSGKKFENAVEAANSIKIGDKNLFPRTIDQSLFGQSTPKKLSNWANRVTPSSRSFGIEVPAQPKFQNPTQLFERTLAENLPTSDIRMGADLMQTLQNQNREFEQYFRNSYEALDRQVRDVPAREMPELVSQLQEMRNSLRGSLVESAAEKQVLKTIDDTLEYLVRPRSNRLPGVSPFEPVSLSDLIKTKKSLGSIADYEVQGGFKKNLQGVRSLVNESIDTFAEEAPEVVSNLRRLDTEFSEYASFYRNEENRKLLDPNNYKYEETYKNNLNYSDFNRLRHVMGGTAEGRRVLNQMHRDLFHKKLGKKLQRASTQREFRDIVDFDTIREIENFRTTLSGSDVHNFQNYIDYILQEEPQLQQRIRQKGLSDLQLRQQFLSAVDEQSPEALMKSLDVLSNARKMKQMLEKTPEGKEIWNGLARFKLEEQFGELLLNQPRKRFNYDQFEKMLNNRETASWIKELGGQEYYDELKKLAEFSSKLSSTTTKLPFNREPSKGAIVKKFGPAAKAMYDIVTGDYIKAVQKFGGAKGSEKGLQMLAKKLSDPEEIKKINEMSKLLAQSKKKKS